MHICISHSFSLNLSFFIPETRDYPCFNKLIHGPMGTLVWIDTRSTFALIGNTYVQVFNLFAQLISALSAYLNTAGWKYICAALDFSDTKYSQCLFPSMKFYALLHDWHSDIWLSHHLCCTIIVCLLFLVIFRKRLTKLRIHVHAMQKVPYQSCAIVFMSCCTNICLQSKPNLHKCNSPGLRYELHALIPFSFRLLMSLYDQY